MTKFAGIRFQTFWYKYSTIAVQVCAIGHNDLNRSFYIFNQTTTIKSTETTHIKKANKKQQS